MISDRLHHARLQCIKAHTITCHVVWGVMICKPLAVRAALAEKKEKRLQELEEENPEKAEAKKDKIRWQNAETRLKGEKVCMIS